MTGATEDQPETAQMTTIAAPDADTILIVGALPVRARRPHPATANLARLVRDLRPAIIVTTSNAEFRHDATTIIRLPDSTDQAPSPAPTPGTTSRNWSGETIRSRSTRLIVVCAESPAATSARRSTADLRETGHRLADVQVEYRTVRPGEHFALTSQWLLGCASQQNHYPAAEAIAIARQHRRSVVHMGGNGLGMLAETTTGPHGEPQTLWALEVGHLAPPGRTAHARTAPCTYGFAILRGTSVAARPQLIVVDRDGAFAAHRGARGDLTSGRESRHGPAATRPTREPAPQ